MVVKGGFYTISFKDIESYEQVRERFSSLEEYQDDVDIHTQAAIALLRRPELAERGTKVFGEGKYSYYDFDFATFVYNHLEFTFSFDSDSIVKSMQEVEAIVRCAEAITKGKKKEKVYKKYIGVSKDEDTIDNLYFCSRLNREQKDFVCRELDYLFREDVPFFTNKVWNDTTTEKSNKVLAKNKNRKIDSGMENLRGMTGIRERNN